MLEHFLLTKLLIFWHFSQNKQTFLKKEQICEKLIKKYASSNKSFSYIFFAFKKDLFILDHPVYFNSLTLPAKIYTQNLPCKNLPAIFTRKIHPAKIYPQNLPAKIYPQNLPANFTLKNLPANFTHKIYPLNFFSYFSEITRIQELNRINCIEDHWSGTQLEPMMMMNIEKGKGLIQWWLYLWRVRYKQHGQRIDLLARVIFPVCFLIFNFIVSFFENLGMFLILIIFVGNIRWHKINESFYQSEK